MARSRKRSPSDRGLGITLLVLLLTDLAATALSFLTSYYLRLVTPVLSPLAHGLDIYLQAWPALCLWPLMLWREGLYPGFWLSIRSELQRIVVASTIAALLAMAATFVTQTGPQFSRPIIVGGWLISIVFIPVFRIIVKLVIKRLGISGNKAIILGAGRTARVLLEGISMQRLPAINPSAIFDDDEGKVGLIIHGVPVIGPLSKASIWAMKRGINTAVIAIPGMRRDRLVPLVEQNSKVFSRIILIPDLFGLSTADITTREIQGVLALEIRNNLLFVFNRWVKRFIDLILLCLSLVIVIPLALLICLALLIESGYPILFVHNRIGKEGKSFKAWKFRTMVKDPEEVFNKALESNQALKQEWESTHKLKQDPRLTKVGRLLRRLSLDELPQLWNLLRGEMSLVGPRPIVEGEIQKYGESYDLYTQVLPGLTGLWQVSGRSDLSYEDRVWLDTHYVRNWSIWLDIVILVRTVWVVLAGVGAY